MVTKRLQVNDMQCNGCAARVQQALMGVQGVVKVITSLDDHFAEVTFDAQKVHETDLRAALQQSGFLKATPSKV
ncbi:MAG: heavy-metal-associated domain-containing protein [Planctomycetota bacterium]|nr:heavy-metal-associated domain-containing protein [Planctomycetota bacterium]